jgi:hypothetical protein
MPATLRAKASGRIKEAFGRIKTIAGHEPTKFRGRERVGWALTFAAAAHSSGAVAEACAGCVNAPATCA